MAKRKKRATGAKRKSAPRGKVRKGSVSARGKAAKRTVAKSKPRKGLAQANAVPGLFESVGFPAGSE